MPSEKLGRERSRAIYRLIGLVYLITIFPIVLTIGFVGGILFMIVDVLLGLVMNEGASSSFGMGLAGFAVRLYRWPLDQAGYIIVGEPDMFRFLP